MLNRPDMPVTLVTAMTQRIRELLAGWEPAGAQTRPLSAKPARPPADPSNRRDYPPQIVWRTFRTVGLSAAAGVAVGLALAWLT